MRSILFTLILLTTTTGSTIRSFSFEGNRRTKESTILKLARIEQGDTISDSLLTLAEERLMKSDLFVSATVTPSDSGDLSISVSEKWTIIPYINGLFSQNRDANNRRISLRAGIYDINFIGRNIILGGEYLYLDGTHNGMFFTGKDNIGSKRIKLRGNFKFSKGINSWFDDQGALEARFIVDRKIGSVSGEIPLLNENLYFGTSLSMYHDTLMESLNSIDSRELNDSSGYSFSGDNSGVAWGISARYSGFKYHRFTYDGWGAKASMSHSFQNNFQDYNTFSVGAQWYKRLPLESNLCMNFRGAVTDAHGDMSYIYVGGTNSVRGFSDGEFKGRAYLNGNFEYRLPSLNTKWIVIQHIFFTDLALVTDRATALDETTYLQGAGVGIRILSPKIYSFMFRFDYGWAWGPYNRNQFYLGTSHAFLPF